MPIIRRYGPAVVTVVHGNHADSVPVPWALLLRDGKRQMLGTPLETPDELRSIGRILKQEDGLLLFQHPSGPIFLVVEVWRTQLDDV
jgi:hypothetical protein